MEETVYLELVCDLTDEEIRRKGDELTTRILEFEDLKAEKKAAAKSYAKRLEQTERLVYRLVNEVHSRRETRRVRCREVFDFTTGTVGIIRTDTAEMVRHREMTSAERQMELPADERPRAEAAAAAAELEQHEMACIKCGEVVATSDLIAGAHRCDDHPEPPAGELQT